MKPFVSALPVVTRTIGPLGMRHFTDMSYLLPASLCQAAQLLP